MSLFGYIFIKLNEKDTNTNSNTNTNTNTNTNKNTNIEIVYNIEDKIEDKINKIFSNIKKRGSYTNLRIDYPWLTI